MPALQKLKEKYIWISHFSSAIELLHWDMETHMPKKGGNWRAQIIGSLSDSFKPSRQVKRSESF